MPWHEIKTDGVISSSYSRRSLMNHSNFGWRTIATAFLLQSNRHAFFSPVVGYVQSPSILSKFRARPFPAVFNERRFVDHSPSTLLLMLSSPISTAPVSLSNQGIEQPRKRRPLLSRNRRQRELRTLLRVGVPSVLAGILAYLIFPGAAILLASSVSSAGALTVLSTDSSQFVQNFLSVSSLLFSILVGQTCTSLFV
jgi:hypothetical protein